jgi:hypothetical protein
MRSQADFNSDRSSGVCICVSLRHRAALVQTSKYRLHRRELGLSNLAAQMSMGMLRYSDRSWCWSEAAVVFVAVVVVHVRPLGLHHKPLIYLSISARFDQRCYRLGLQNLLFIEHLGWLFCLRPSEEDQRMS